MSRPPAPAECAVCGAAIPAGARACPACGADERTGWREPSLYDGLDLPDEAFAGDRPEPDRNSGRQGQTRIWQIVALIMLAVIVVLAVLNRFWVAP